MTTISKLSYALFFISLILWIIANYISSICDPALLNNIAQFKYREDRTKPDTPHQQASAHQIKEILDWFNTSLPKDLPVLSNSCPPVYNYYKSKSPTVSVAAIGEINLNTSLAYESKLLDAISLKESILGETEVVMSSLISPPAKHIENEQLITVLQSLSDMGVSLVSLANQQSLDIKETETKAVVRSLEDVGIGWVGLNVRRHEILQVQDMRIGVLGFCGVHGQCLETNARSPFAPSKYHVRETRDAVNEIKKHNVDHIIVLLHWGKEHSYFPDELELYVARHLSDSDSISAIIGFHPQNTQGHAYFGNTLVIFSPGNFIIAGNSDTLCWEKEPNGNVKWEYNTNNELCHQYQYVHPSLHHSLQENEHKTRLYKFHLRKSEPVTADYITLPLINQQNQLMYPDTSSSTNEWITVCGDSDNNCLSCKPF